jgi:hypothetical protein
MRPRVVQWKHSYRSSALERELFRALSRDQLPAQSTLSTAVLSKVGTAEQLRARVLQLAERFRNCDARGTGQEIARRRFEALVRCDLHGEKADCVARSLGISPRQLRRERSAARRRMLRAILEDSRGDPATELRSPATIAVSNAARLHGAGQTALARAALRSIAAEADQTETRIDALALCAQIENEMGAAEEAERALIHARLLLQQPLEDDATRHLCRARVELAQRDLDRTAGRFADAAGQEQLAMCELHSSGVLRLRAGRELLTSALLDRAELQMDNDRGRRDLAQALRLIAEDRLHLTRLALDAAILQLNLALRSGAYASAEATLTQALPLAYELGFADRAVFAATYLVQLHFMRGAFAAARTEARRCVTYAQRLGLPTPLARATLVAAQLELLLGDAPSARSLLAPCTRYVTPNSHYALQLRIETAYLFLVEGRYGSALRTAKGAEGLAQGIGLKSAHGRALLHAAGSHLALGDRKQAEEEALAAVDLLERYGGRLWTALAYRQLSRIARRREYERVAHDLFPHVPALS